MSLGRLLGPAAASNLVDATGNAERGALPVDIRPPQGAQLATACTGESCEQQQAGERRFDCLGRFDDALYLVRARCHDLGRVNRWGSRSVGDVAIDKVPPFGLTQRGANHGVDTPDARRLQSSSRELRVQPVQVGRCQLGEPDPAQLRAQGGFDGSPMLANPGLLT